jgi:hypothetical protein
MAASRREAAARRPPPRYSPLPLVRAAACRPLRGLDQRIDQLARLDRGEVVALLRADSDAALS